MAIRVEPNSGVQRSARSGVRINLGVLGARPLTPDVRRLIKSIVMIHLWEYLPYADRLAGPRWFRRFVVDPIPEHITEVRGRYRGSLVKGFVLITFKFAPPFEGGPWMMWWHESEVSALIKGFLKIVYKDPNNYQKQYCKGKDAGTFMLLDEEAGRGALYIASWMPIFEALRNVDV